MSAHFLVLPHLSCLSKMSRRFREAPAACPGTQFSWFKKGSLVFALHVSHGEVAALLDPHKSCRNPSSCPSVHTSRNLTVLLLLLLSLIWFRTRKFHSYKQIMFFFLSLIFLAVFSGLLKVEKDIKLFSSYN